MHSLIYDMFFLSVVGQINKWTQQNHPLALPTANSQKPFELEAVRSSQHGCATLDSV